MIKPKNTMRNALAGVASGVLANIWGVSLAAADPAADALPVLFSGIAHDALFAVCLKGKEGLAVGADGILVESHDSGVTWEKAPKPIADMALLGLSCEAHDPITVGQGGVIFIRKDGKWNRVDSGTDQRLLSVASNASGLAVAVGGFGTVLLSKDAGATWESAGIDWSTITDDGAEPHVYDASISGAGVITIVGEFGLVLRSEDTGATWRTVNKGDSSLFSLHFRDDDNGFAVGQEGTILKTVDGGLTWVAQAVKSNANLLDVWSSPAGKVVVTGIRALLRSDDDGATWRSVKDGDIPIAWYQAVAAAELPDGASQNVVMVGRSGRIVQVR